jgi:hypothetical protein
VANPNGGKRLYLIGLQNGLWASVRAGRISFTFKDMSPSGNKQAMPYFCKEYQSLHARTLQKVSGAFHFFFHPFKTDIYLDVWLKMPKFPRERKEKKMSFQKQEGSINPAGRAFGNQSCLCDPA